MLKNKIFSKIFGLIMLTSLLAGMFSLFITFQDRTRLAEQALIQENKLLAEVTANMIVAGYLTARWPFQTLKLISDSEGIVFLWIVKPNGEIYFADNSAMFGKFIQDPSLLSIDEPLVKDGLSEEGEKVKLIIHPLKMELGEEPWALYLGVSLKPIEVVARKTIIIAVIAIISIIFLTGLISFYFSLRITRPLEQLRTGAMIIGKGNLGHRIKLKTGDEIEELAESFNQMAEDLKQSYLTLEESKKVLEIRVKARTKELKELAGSLEEQVKEKTKELQKKLEELDQIAKLLIRRDLALTEANERLVAMDKAKSEFIAIAAHQLRTPLSGVKWTLKMMIDEDLGSLTEEQKKFLKRGYQTNERMIHLVNDLLNVARIEEGRLVYTIQEFYLEDLIEEIIKGFARNIKKKHLDLKFTKPEKQLPKIKADSEKIRLVLDNLLDNAILYTPNHGQIKINIEQENNQLKTSIHDSGIGIPKEQQERVFDKFFRGSNVMKTAVEGTGLGLYIVKNIIKAHNGDIGFESQENKGSVFWFSLPIGL